MVNLLSGLCNVLNRSKTKNMSEIKLENIGDFKKFVEGMKINTKYLLPDNFRYKWIKIEKNSGYYSKEYYYSWSMEYNYKVTGIVGYIFPLSVGNKITHFKTENGAKKNFLKKYARYFEPL